MLRLFCVIYMVLMIGSRLYAQSGPPPARKQAVTDEYHGVKVVDEYRWLEDWSKPETQTWSDAQTAYARMYLDALPGREALRARIAEITSRQMGFYGALRRRGNKWFALRFQPPKEQRFLVEIESPDKPEPGRVLLDPVQLDPTGQTAIDFYVPSTDGKYVAVSLSKGGSESGDVNVYEIATGKKLPDVVERVNGGTAGGSVAWNASGSGFYYTRYSRAGERASADLDFYQQIWFHRLGTESSKADTYSHGKDFPRIAEIQMESSEDGRSVLAKVANGDGGEFLHYLLGPDGSGYSLRTSPTR